jgi:plasmid maintenance system antidote protein VapI
VTQQKRNVPFGPFLVNIHELSRITGIERSQVSRIVHRQRRCSLKQARKLAAALTTTVDHIASIIEGDVAKAAL